MSVLYICDRYNDRSEQAGDMRTVSLCADDPEASDICVRRRIGTVDSTRMLCPRCIAQVQAMITEQLPIDGSGSKCPIYTQPSPAAEDDSAAEAIESIDLRARVAELEVMLKEAERDRDVNESEYKRIREGFGGRMVEERNRADKAEADLDAARAEISRLASVCRKAEEILGERSQAYEAVRQERDASRAEVERITRERDKLKARNAFHMTVMERRPRDLGQRFPTYDQIINNHLMRIAVEDAQGVEK